MSNLDDTTRPTREAPGKRKPTKVSLPCTTPGKRRKIRVGRPKEIRRIMVAPGVPAEEVTATGPALSMNPDDMKPPGLAERVEGLRKKSKGHDRTKVSMHGCPTYLKALWQQVIEERRLPVGMTLTVAMMAGLEELRGELETQRFDAIAKKVRQADYRELPLKGRTALARAVGTSGNPGIPFTASLPCGETVTWDFKAPAKPARWLYGRAAQFGMSASALAVYAVGRGLAVLLRDEGGIDPEAERALSRDRLDLLRAINAKAQELEDLWELYARKG